MPSSTMERRRGYCLEGAATGLATQLRSNVTATGSELRRRRLIARYAALTSANPPAPDRQGERGSEIDTMSLDIRIFLLPLSRSLRNPVIDRATPCTAESAPCRRARESCDETNGVQRASASRMPRGA